MRADELILVSVDDHVVEPPDMFEQHLTDAWKARAPRVVRKSNGTEVWVSKWNLSDSKEPNGEIVIFDAKTLEEIGRVKGLYAPTGKFNVYNRSNHVT